MLYLKLIKAVVLRKKSLTSPIHDSQSINPGNCALYGTADKSKVDAALKINPMVAEAF